MWTNLCCFVEYVVLFHDGSQKTVTIKGLRRMSPMLGEKHAVDLEVRMWKAYRPLVVNCEETFMYIPAQKNSDPFY